MVTIEEGFCHNDSDCSAEQYCYQVSERCVDYTICNRYNREENKKRARNPSQCGPCLPGYAAEKLSTGDIATLCRKINANGSAPDIPQTGNNVTSYLTGSGIFLICILLAMAIGIFYKRWSRRRPKHQGDLEKYGDLCTVKPSAPPIENCPFIDYGRKLPYVPFNNKNLQDKNRLVSASGFKAPSWINSNPNYEANLNNDSTNVMEQLQSVTELSSNGDNSNAWTSEQLTPARGTRTEYEIEEVDNNANAILSSENISTNESRNYNTNNGNTNSNNNNSSTSENNSEDDREHVRASNVLSMSMNLNVLWRLLPFEKYK
ncbi:uncharacterized protein LOC143186495 [Calliopsis andreniformis]|uniref:uncharacterized protein LOC143186495 n=1 Tax=Calliopsis andreniformis TaxID=337506 RepID=UPI003FCC7CE2